MKSIEHSAIETLAGHAISAEFTRPRRTDTPEVREALARGDFADARWLRCEHQLELLEDAPTREDRANMRGFIVTSSKLMDMGDQMAQARPPGARVERRRPRLRAARSPSTPRSRDHQDRG